MADIDLPRPVRRAGALGPDSQSPGLAVEDWAQLGSHVRTLTSEVDQLPPVCPWCTRPLYVTLGWYCETSTVVDRDSRVVQLGPVVTPRTDDGRCGCNWCLVARAGQQPGRGRPRKHCGAVDCRKAYNRARQRERRSKNSLG